MCRDGRKRHFWKRKKRNWPVNIWRKWLSLINDQRNVRTAAVRRSARPAFPQTPAADGDAGGQPPSSPGRRSHTFIWRLFPGIRVPARHGSETRARNGAKGAAGGCVHLRGWTHPGPGRSSESSGRREAGGALDDGKQTDYRCGSRFPSFVFRASAFL